MTEGEIEISKGVSLKERALKKFIKLGFKAVNDRDVDLNTTLLIIAIILIIVSIITNFL